MASESSDDLISQFMAFTGCADGDRAQQYLEMSNMNVETAVGLFMEHQHAGNSAPGGLDASSLGTGPPQVRAPDRTRTMRLMDDGMGPGYDMIDDQDVVMNAFAHVDARAAVNAAAAADSVDTEQGEEAYAKSDEIGGAAGLSDMFAPPSHLMYKAGGFQGARNVAKDARRWLLVNIQKDSEFSCHALNRDVWRDELVENLVREGFILWQAMNDSPDGQTYSERYNVFDFPHLAIIDPRTGRSLWKKEGWTQEKPFSAADFAEMAMDFCSRHSFDSAPLPTSKKTARGPVGLTDNGGFSGERKRPFMNEQEQLQAAMAASLKSSEAPCEAPDNVGDDEEDEYVMDEDDEDSEIEYLGTANEILQKEERKEEPPSFIMVLLATVVGDEPSDGARIQLRMPDATRMVRKFSKSDAVKTIYAFVAQSIEEARGGKEFLLMAGFPPKNLEQDMDSSIDSCGLNGQAVTVRWKN